MALRVVVVYDISDDGVRLRVARTLESWGLYRIQRSAFVGRMQRARMRDLARLLEGMIDPGTDTVHIIPLPSHEWERTLVLGTPWGERRVASAALLQG
ncbi:CRISPR-associated endonuclease Cas2 [Aeropyrum camini]|uniref:CRISPR-associated endoribonuclease Cas2 n=1 Tax=Aeropyrum camini SY1 = JCM 12091 TaxID=1198449 RepID=U3TER2_9CREN|nr:CRISPR-associated endonuclease Cas2 [Aeropyrum camini]BAN89814.1 CRISPR-associated protein Cas2 family [Aeropyrum camini SY1 = JCM 12091]